MKKIIIALCLIAQSLLSQTYTPTPSQWNDTRLPLDIGGNYLHTTSYARLVVTTTATTASVEMYSTSFATYPQFSSIGVRVNGVNYTTLFAVRTGATTASVSLPAGEKTVEFINGLQSRPAGIVGTFVHAITFNAAATFSNTTTSNRLIIYGNSITSGANADSLPLHGMAQMIRASWSGSVVNDSWGYRALWHDNSTAAATSVFAAYVDSLAPSVIYIDIGTNDFGTNKWNASDFGIAYARMLDSLHARRPVMKIIAQTPIPRGDYESANAYGNTLPQYRAQIASACASRSWVKLIDGTAILTTGDLTDGVHPSTAGQIKYAAYIDSVLKTITTVKNYYISSSGSDANDGTSSLTPWKTLSKAHWMTVNPGDAILLKRGDTLSGMLARSLSGKFDSLITIGAYGTGARPVLRGDFALNTWAAEPARDGYYKTYTGRATLATRQYEDSAGTWRQLTVRGDATPVSIAENRSGWLDALPVGAIGPTNTYGKDTVFLRTVNGGSPGRLWLEWENALSITYSKYVVIRDIEMIGYNNALYLQYDTNIVVLNCLIRNNAGTAIMVHSGEHAKIDSCKIDSCGYTALYNYLGSHTSFAHDTVLHVVDTIRGKYVSSSEQCAFGDQGSSGVGVYGTGHEVKIEHCFTDFIDDAAIDTYMSINDTLRYNIFNLNQGGMYLHGKGFFADSNVITVKNTTGTLKGLQINGTEGTNIVSHNSFTIPNSGNNTMWGIRVSGLYSGATVALNSNTVTMWNANAEFDSFIPTTGITSTNNSFIGAGKWIANTTTYSSLSTFKSATGYESGSTWDGEPAPVAVRKVLIKRRY